MSKICVVIATYNEAENLQSLTAQIEEELGSRNFSLIIVDDNSPDKTARVAEEQNRIYGNVIVRTRAIKCGLGSAILEGLKTALDMKDVEQVVTLDGDLSHNPREIPRLLHASQKKGLVQGSRYVEHGTVIGWGLNRRLISCGANLICKLLLRTSTQDCTGNFRVYSRECAEAIVNSTVTKGFEWVVEALLVAKKHGFLVREVPITFVGRREGKTKLKALEMLSWAIFATKSLFSLKPLNLNALAQSKHAIHRSSTFTVTAVAPITSATTYTLSRASPGLSDQAELMCSVRSTE
ncbi:MAG: polyprenol monophosphomannose synthase [Candidatus Bathyarchaeia archaeon]